MLELLLDFSALSAFFEAVVDSFLPKLDEFADDDDAPDDAETEVRMLLDFFKVTPCADDGQRGFSRHSSGLNDEKSARIPLSVTRDKFFYFLFEKFNAKRQRFNYLSSTDSPPWWNVNI